MQMEINQRVRWLAVGTPSIEAHAFPTSVGRPTIKRGDKSLCGQAEADTFDEATGERSPPLSKCPRCWAMVNRVNLQD
jgi:hypothetical protein